MSSPSIWRTNPPLKGRGHGHLTHFKLRAPNDISETADASRHILYTGRLYQVLAFDDKPPLKGVWTGSRDLFSISTPAIISLKRQKQESPNLVCW